MIRVGLYGFNGHQIHSRLANHPRARVVAVAPRKDAPPALFENPRIRFYDTYAELIADPEVELVSLCSPRRVDQARQALQAMRSGKHVLAEKPCALAESDLDALIAASAETGRRFHEMAGTAFEQPYHAMREVVRQGLIGEVVQVIAEKSYPYHGARPQDEELDGGLIAQSAIHALRFVEHVACARIASLRAVDTALGNPVASGGLRIASSMMLTLANGGVASLSANYLNPRGTGIWGDESLKILGTLGIVESRAGGKFTRLVVGDHDLGPLNTGFTRINWLDTYFEHIATRAPMPLTLAEELSPTRWAIRARLDANRSPRPGCPPVPPASPVQRVPGRATLEAGAVAG